MKSPMQIWRHLAGVALCCLLFVAGKLMVDRSHKWPVRRLTRHNASSGQISKFFLVSGRFCEALALVGGFVETVAVMVLASGWLIDLFTAVGAE